MAGGRHPWRLYEALLGHGVGLLAREPGGLVVNAGPTTSRSAESASRRTRRCCRRRAPASAATGCCANTSRFPSGSCSSRWKNLRRRGRGRTRRRAGAGGAAGSSGPGARGGRVARGSGPVRHAGDQPVRAGRWSRPGSTAGGATCILLRTGCGRSISRCIRCSRVAGDGAAGPSNLPPALCPGASGRQGGRRAPTTRSSGGSAWRPRRRSSAPALSAPGGRDRPGPARATRSGYAGGELYLALVDGNAPPWPEGIDRLHVKARCTNRDLPLFMPLTSRGRPISMSTAARRCCSVQCLGEPTRPRPSLASADPAAPSVGRVTRGDALAAREPSDAATI